MNSSHVSIEPLASLTEDDRAALVAPLDTFSRDRGFAFSPTGITFVLRHRDSIIGGLAGQVYWEWLHIELLAVPDALRGQGIGRALVAHAEHRAIQEGCHGAWVDTYSFQSPGFYEKLGYERFGELPNYPAGEHRIFLRKMFAPKADEERSLG